MMMQQMVIPYQIHIETERFLKRRGGAGKEGLVLWAGCCGKQIDVVLSMVKAGGSWAHGVRLSFKQMIKLTGFLSSHSLILLAQVHNHPDRFPHSLGDYKNPASHRPAYLSIVVPEMGLKGINFLDCYTYEYVKELTWRELDEIEKAQRFIVLPKGLKL